MNEDRTWYAINDIELKGFHFHERKENNGNKRQKIKGSC